MERKTAFTVGPHIEPQHAAPDGAWKVFRGSSAIYMALLTELCHQANTLLQPKAGKNLLPNWSVRRHPATRPG